MLLPLRVELDGQCCGSRWWRIGGQIRRLVQSPHKTAGFDRLDVYAISADNVIVCLFKKNHPHLFPCFFYSVHWHSGSSPLYIRVSWLVSTLQVWSQATLLEFFFFFLHHVKRQNRFQYSNGKLFCFTTMSPNMFTLKMWTSRCLFFHKYNSIFMLFSQLTLSTFLLIFLF